MITCLSTAQMLDFITIVGEGWVTRVANLIIINAEVGDVVWKYNAATELFCRVPGVTS